MESYSMGPLVPGYLLNIMFMGFIILLCVVGDGLFSLLCNHTVSYSTILVSILQLVGI